MVKIYSRLHQQDHVFKKRGSYSMTFGAHSYVPDKEMKNHLFIKEGGVDHNPEFEVDQQSIGSSYLPLMVISKILACLGS